MANRGYLIITLANWCLRRRAHLLLNHLSVTAQHLGLVRHEEGPRPHRDPLPAGHGAGGPVAPGRSLTARNGVIF